MTGKTVCIVQARMSSTRLPGKVIKLLGGKEVLWHVVNRVRHCSLLSEAVVATSNSATDDCLEEFCQNQQIPCYRGSLTNVLERYYQAATAFDAETIVRVTADCPLVDPDILTTMLRSFQQDPCDYLSNGFPSRTFPEGLDLEIFTYSALSRAVAETSDSYHLEHVTPYFYNSPQKFCLRGFTSSVDRSHLRWTLDTPEDYQMLSDIYRSLYREEQIIKTEEVLEYLGES